MLFIIYQVYNSRPEPKSEASLKRAVAFFATNPVFRHF